MKIWDKLRRPKVGASGKRITNDTIDEHREKILSKGRKFKYPFQYAKYKLVINTVIIALVAMLTLLVFGWLELYKFQNMSDIMYRFTRVIPVPVANIDEENVRYSDFLMLYRSSIAVVENQQGKLGDSDENNVLKGQYKRQALDAAVEYTYALKLARELDIKVTDEQISEAEKEHRIVDGVERSEESFANIIETNFGLSVKEYESLLKLSLTRKQVAIEIDKVAKDMVAETKQELSKGAKLEEVAGALGGKVFYEATGGFVDNLNLDGGRAGVASRLKDGEISEVFVSKSGDAYYFVQLIEKTDTQVNYTSLKVPLMEFSKRLMEVKKQEKIKEYIKIEAKNKE